MLCPGCSWPLTQAYVLLLGTQFSGYPPQAGTASQKQTLTKDKGLQTGAPAQEHRQPRGERGPREAWVWAGEPETQTQCH